MNCNNYHFFIYHQLLTICLICCGLSPLFAQNQAIQTYDTDSLKISQINIFGNKITKEKIIIRELSFQEGIKIPAENIDDYFEKEENKLRNTNLFVTQDIAWYPISEDNIVINIFLKERWYTFPIPLIELADRSFNEWWTNQNRDLSRIEYGLNFKRKNFRGRKEDLGLLLQFGFTNKKQSLGITFRTSYSENNNIAYNSIGNKLQNVDFDQNIMRRKFDFRIALTKRVGFYDFHRFSVEYNNVRIADTVAYLNPNYFLNGNTLQRYFEIRYTYTHDYRDFSAYPLKGSYFNIFFNKIGAGIFDDVNVFNVNANYAKYFHLGGKFYFATSATGKLSVPEVQPYVNNRALGYNQAFVRGYDLYVIEGQHFGLQKNTLRFKFLDNRLDMGKLMPIEQFSTMPVEMYFKTYFDVGYVRNSTVDFFNEALSNKPLWGTGIGIDLEVKEVFSFISQVIYNFSVLTIHSFSQQNL